MASYHTYRKDYVKYFILTCPGNPRISLALREVTVVESDYLSINDAT